MEKIDSYLTQRTTELLEKNIRNLCIISEVEKDFLSITPKLEIMWGMIFLTTEMRNFWILKNHHKQNLNTEEQVERKYLQVITVKYLLRLPYTEW